MSERVLIVAPHPDDEAIGCGGTICLHRRRRDPVSVVFLTSGERGLEEVPAEQAWAIREAEAKEAAAILGVENLDFLRLPDQGVDDCIEQAAQLLRNVLATHQPDLIYLPHAEESHPDHAAALMAARIALEQDQDVSKVPELRGYEIWSPMTRPGWIEDISGVIRRKMRAIHCYRSQLRSFRYDWAIRGLNRYRGILNAGSRYAEAFRFYDLHSDSQA